MSVDPVQWRKLAASLNRAGEHELARYARARAAEEEHGQEDKEPTSTSSGVSPLSAHPGRSMSGKRRGV